ncbi:sensor histidine kinase [Pedobacter jejuensis]|nr:ATP-binding protein [Pedobacter jejuensis]
MIKGFLNASSFEAGKIYLNEETFEMNLLIDEILEDTKLLNSSHQVLLSPCTPISVNADRDKIGQVIQNFLSNAIKYSPKGGKIELSCKALDGMLQVGVHDEGLGIKIQDQAKLFDRYYRIESQDTPKIAGFGLGLYLSSEIIQHHNGKVWVESEVDKGSSFYFNLPLLSQENKNES